MFKKARLIIITASIAVSSLFFYSFKDDSFEIVKNLDIYYTLFKELNLYYVDEIKPGDLVKKSIDEMLQSLDPYTSYITESEIEDYRFMTTGQYGGIGALIRGATEYVVITDPYEGYPANKAGLKAGDMILEIDGKTTKGKNSSDISELLKGQPNTPVKLLIKRPFPDEQFEKTLQREEIKIKNVNYSGMIDDQVAYIRLMNFTEQAGKEVKDALQELKEKKNAKYLILDLRGNPGGLLMEAVNIVNLFVDQGQDIVSTKGKVKQWDKTYKATSSPIDKEIPIVVLVNSGSASASEIVSGAIQDIDRGVVIGQRTFGKGLVQTTRDLTYNAKLKVTTAKYYIPSGRCIQALDYSHRNIDGSVGKVPDSLITEFKTKKGRKVYDGGGVNPDITIEPERLSKISESLFIKNYIFDYATKFANEKKQIVAAKEFHLSDAEYDDFIKFLSGKNFDYETKSEETLKQLKEIAKNEKYLDIAQSEFDALQKKLAHDKEKDLRSFKEEIKELIEDEIIGRYYFQSGRVEASLAKDEAVKKAVEVLKDPKKYSAILDGSATSTSK
ncbi:MAG: peptidase S41 [Bacteroidetes bacterium RIFOXYA12_FULL_35_11]|nr:MAG: peptidase S41 [Bacteroidetes bacterium GWF2_35_48]OFY82508.1 MAG: peptidase S41 [Bacteroidetes bacterium RIFOXYA12_FULL_35_11]OFZ01528.1 MAG: peptidase S41 [Bacteroidetes bacterium RIFOXYC12_FULL_35_7]HBX53369.1 peptidase S41 [Bacteroidales bacterium]